MSKMHDDVVFTHMVLSIAYLVGLLALSFLLRRIVARLEKLRGTALWLGGVFVLSAAVCYLYFTGTSAEHHARRWDKQIEEDLDAGRLDTLLAKVDKEYRAGLAKPSCTMPPCILKR